MSSASEFDQFSGNYKDLHDASVSITGETGEYFAAYKAKYIASLIIPGARPAILDYGCGVGLMSEQLKKHLPDARIDGYDVSRACLDQISPKLRQQGTFTSETSDLGRSYDVVVIANVLHHVKPEDRQNIVAEAGGLSERNGRLIVFEHNPANPLTRLAVERCPFDENAILLPPGETVEYFKRAGLNQVSRRYIVFFPRFLKWLRGVERSLGWCPLGAQYVVSGTRK